MDDRFRAGLLPRGHADAQLLRLRRNGDPHDPGQFRQLPVQGLHRPSGPGLVPRERGLCPRGRPHERHGQGQVRAGHHPQPRHGRYGPLPPLRRQGQRDERLPGRSGERVVRRGRCLGPAEGDRHGLRGRHIPPDGGDQPSGHGAHAAALCEDRQGNGHDPDGRPQPLAGCRSGRLVGC